MTTQSLLIVEDDPVLLRGLKDNFEALGYRVRTANDGQRGLDALRQEPPDLLVLDLMLPKVNGYEICQAARSSDMTMPIIMLTAKGQEEDIVRGLELGADDYVTKPFSPRELTARARAVLRRMEKQGAGQGVLRSGNIQLDQAGRSVRVGEQPVELTPSEFDLLATLMAAPGRVFSRLELLDRLQGTAYEGYERTIDVHVRNLRTKIEPDPSRPHYIETVYGSGYRFTSRE